MDAENTGQKSGPGEITSSSVTSVDFETPDSMVGRKLDGRFVIEKNLTDGGADEGGIGVVYLARDLKMINKRVVVKVLQEAALKHKDILRKFLHEEEALMRLDHPGIVRILDFGKLSDGNPFMVMEYIEGHSLRKALRTQGPFPLDVAAHLIESITDALSAAHAEKIVHRDIKPENIMLTPQEGSFDRVRLIDFGIARVDESTLAPKTEISRAIGTVRYISPEQLAGSLYLGPPADIYSVGVVAYEMLTGQLPFRPETMIHMYRLQQEGLTTTPRELRPEMPAEAEAILLSALDFDAEKRPQNARAFGRDLARSLRAARLAPLYETEDVSSYRTEMAGDEVVTAHRPSSVPTGQGPAAKSTLPLKWIAAGVILFAALALATGIVAWNIIGPIGPPITPNPAANSSPVPVNIGADREISYHLMIQKMRYGKEFEKPFRSFGPETVFEAGYKFSMVFDADADGYFYMWNEGKDKNGITEYSPLFPSPSVRGGLSKAPAREEIATARNEFTGGRGTEVFYLVWSKLPQEDLETIWRMIQKGENTIRDAGQVETLLSFQTRYETEKPVAEIDETNERMRIKGKGDVVVQKIAVKHQ